MLLKYSVKRNKISVLKTFGIIGDDETNDFATILLLEEKDLDTKLEIVNCLYKIDATFLSNFKHSILKKLTGFLDYYLTFETN